MAIDMERARKYARMTAAKRALDAKLKDVNKALSEMEEGLLEDFAEEGVASVKVEARPATANRPAQVVTIFLQEELWVNAPVVEGSDERDYNTANQWLIDNDDRFDTADMVQPRFNAATLSAFARAYKRENGALPEGMEEAFDVRGGYRARVRSA